jgi:hemerythrin
MPLFFTTLYPQILRKRQLEEHHTIHNDLLDQLDRLDRKTVCDSTALQYELLQFLMDWLMNHTSDVDKRYGPFLNSKGVY